MVSARSFHFQRPLVRQSLLLTACWPLLALNKAVAGSGNVIDDSKRLLSQKDRSSTLGRSGIASFACAL